MTETRRFYGDRPDRIEWTPAKVAILKRMWDAGTSAALIAPRLGCSRSAVLGKLFRLKMKRGAA